MVVPSQVNESFSLVVREALQHNKVVISSKCGGPEDIIIDGVNGFLFPKDSKEKLSDLLNNCLHSYREVVSTIDFSKVRIKNIDETS